MMKMMHKITIPHGRTPFYCILFIIVGAFIIYFNSLPGEFIGDDEILIEKNVGIQNCSFKNIKNIFFSSFFDIMHPSLGRNTGIDGGSYYRPLCMVSYLFDYALWNDIVFGYHLTNVILHIISVVLLFIFLRFITNATLFSFIVATIFLTHPMHSRHIASLSGRTDLLCLVFFIMSLLLYGYNIRARTSVQKNIYIAFSFLSFFCALLSKEMAIMLPFVVILYDVCFGGVNGMRTFMRRSGTYIAFFLILILYIYIRYHIVGVGIGYFFDTSVQVYPFLRLLTCGGILVSFLREVFFPFQLNYSWHYVPLVTAYGGKELVVLCLVSILFGISAYVSWRTNKVLFFGLGWFCITYFPASNIIPVWPGIAEYTLFVGKQFLHIPLVGLCIACISIIFALVGYLRNSIIRKMCLWFFIMTVLIFSLVTIYHNIVWLNPYYYYTKVLQQIPNSVEARIGLAIAHLRKGEIEKAVALFHEALDMQEAQGSRIRITPLPYQNLISIYYNVLEKYDEARALCYRGLSVFPDYYVFYYFLAGVSFKDGHYDEAISYSKKALSVNPTFHYCIQSLYTLLSEYSNSEKDSIQRYRQRIQNDPTDVHAYYRLARLYQDYYLYERAIDYYQQALRIDPHFHIARSNLIYCYEQLSLTSKAQEEREKMFLTPI